MRLAKDFIDIGVQTNQLHAMIPFWQQQIGLPFEELLKVGGGIHQHRHTLNGSVFKLNSVRDPLPADDPTGYRELLIARESVEQPQSMTDPDGNRVTLVPPGYQGITHIGMQMDVSSLEKFSHFYRNVLGIECVSDNVYQWATTRFFLRENPALQPVARMRGIGYRYITVQVWDVDQEHQRFLARGGTEGLAPTTLGTTARISFIQDPDCNWIEVSQRASLTGKL